MKKPQLTRHLPKTKKQLFEINYGGKHSAGGHEDTAYGIFDRPGFVEKTDAQFELPSLGGPIVPSEMVATQLATERPPINDPDYVPSTLKDLAYAVAEMVKAVPNEQIRAFYVKCQALVEKTIAENEVTAEGDNDMSEANLRKRVSAHIQEAMSQSDADLRKRSAELMQRMLSQSDEAYLQSQFDDEFGPEYEEAEEEELEPEVAPETDDHDETSLADIAGQTGFLGPSGVKNFLYRLLRRVERFSNIPDDEFDALIEFGAHEYLDLLSQSKAIDADDARYMSQNMRHVLSLPSFRYFLFHALILPAAKEVEKQSDRAIKQQLDKMGLSARVQNSVLNQLTGGVPRNDVLISKQLSAEVKSGKMKAHRARELADEIANKFRALQNLAKGGDDFAEIALKKYSTLDKKKLISILTKGASDPYVTAVAAAE